MRAGVLLAVLPHHREPPDADPHVRGVEGKPPPPIPIGCIYRYMFLIRPQLVSLLGDG